MHKGGGEGGITTARRNILVSQYRDHTRSIEDHTDTLLCIWISSKYFNLTFFRKTTGERFETTYAIQNWVA